MSEYILERRETITVHVQDLVSHLFLSRDLYEFYIVWTPGPPSSLPMAQYAAIYLVSAIIYSK